MECCDELQVLLIKWIISTRNNNPLVYKNTNPLYKDMVPVKLSYFYIGYDSSPLNVSDFRMYVIVECRLLPRLNGISLIYQKIKIKK